MIPNTASRRIIMHDLERSVDGAQRGQEIHISLMRDEHIEIEPEGKPKQIVTYFYMKAPYTPPGHDLSLGTVTEGFEQGPNRDQIMEQLKHYAAMRLMLYAQKGPVRFSSVLLKYRREPVTPELLAELMSDHLPFEMGLLDDPAIDKISNGARRLLDRLDVLVARERA